MTAVDPSIFKAYDVRGIYPDQMDEDVAYLVGNAFARVIAEGEGADPSELTLALGRDMRLSAPALTARYADGMRDAGVNVMDIGMVGTEMLYYAVGSRNLAGGLMCTASHNPKAYTGAKLVKRDAVALSGDSGIAEVKHYVTQGEPARAERQGERSEEDVSEGASDEGGPRRRQRDGRAYGRADPRRAATRAGDDLLGAGRRVPRPRAQPPAPREPLVRDQEGALRGCRAGNRLGRRRRPLLLHR
jgi:hypothetical protein